MIRDEFYASDEFIPIGAVVSIVAGRLGAWRISERSGVVIGKDASIYRVRVSGRAFALATLRTDVVKRFRALTDDEVERTGIISNDARFVPGSQWRIDIVPDTVVGLKDGITESLNVWNVINPPAFTICNNDSFKLTSIANDDEFRLLVRVEDLNLFRDAAWSYYSQETVGGDLISEKHSIIDGENDYWRALAKMAQSYPSGSAGSIEVAEI